MKHINKEECKGNSDRASKEIPLTMLQVSLAIRKSIPKSTGEEINDVLVELGFKLIVFPCYE